MIAHPGFAAGRTESGLQGSGGFLLSECGEQSPLFPGGHVDDESKALIVQRTPKGLDMAVGRVIHDRYAPAKRSSYNEISRGIEEGNMSFKEGLVLKAGEVLSVE